MNIRKEFRPAKWAVPRVRRTVSKSQTCKLPKLRQRCVSAPTLPIVDSVYKVLDRQIELATKEYTELRDPDSIMKIYVKQKNLRKPMLPLESRARLPAHYEFDLSAEDWMHKRTNDELMLQAFERAAMAREELMQRQVMKENDAFNRKLDYSLYAGFAMRFKPLDKEIFSATKEPGRLLELTIHSNATRIQRVWSGALKRLRDHKQRTATVFQAAWKGYLIKKRWRFHIYPRIRLMRDRQNFRTLEILVKEWRSEAQKSIRVKRFIANNMQGTRAGMFNRWRTYIKQTKQERFEKMRAIMRRMLQRNLLKIIVSWRQFASTQIRVRNMMMMATQNSLAYRFHSWRNTAATIKQDRLEHHSSIIIQRITRGHFGRKRADEIFAQRTRVALHLQCFARRLKAKIRVQKLTINSRKAIRVKEEEGRINKLKERQELWNTIIQSSRDQVRKRVKTPMVTKSSDYRTDLRSERLATNAQARKTTSYWRLLFTRGPAKRSDVTTSLQNSKTEYEANEAARELHEKTTGNRYVDTSDWSPLQSALSTKFGSKTLKTLSWKHMKSKNVFDATAAIDFIQSISKLQKSSTSSQIDLKSLNPLFHILGIPPDSTSKLPPSLFRFLKPTPKAQKLKNQEFQKERLKYWIEAVNGKHNVLKSGVLIDNDGKPIIDHSTSSNNNQNLNNNRRRHDDDNGNNSPKPHKDSSDKALEAEKREIEEWKAKQLDKEGDYQKQRIINEKSQNHNEEEENEESNDQKANKTATTTTLPNIPSSSTDFNEYFLRTPKWADSNIIKLKIIIDSGGSMALIWSCLLSICQEALKWLESHIWNQMISTDESRKANGNLVELRCCGDQLQGIDLVKEWSERHSLCQINRIKIWKIDLIEAHKLRNKMEAHLERQAKAKKLLLMRVQRARVHLKNQNIAHQELRSLASGALGYMVIWNNFLRVWEERNQARKDLKEFVRKARKVCYRGWLMRRRDAAILIQRFRRRVLLRRAATFSIKNTIIKVMDPQSG
eukprot:TRINITY_DN22243_c0_g1_i1.p1 TRINITY_DN22243_c0_g1~~TRINITY_DN22243_c0_g1_i1.p1  ORF type:complete len:1005 (-),score=217.47 TRINITY_DN22243_c0_g1_i1:69-3083(-)